MAFVNLDGKLLEDAQPVLNAGNRSFRYGYGLVETMLLRDGAISLREYHWQRLWRGLEQLKFVLPKHFTPRMLEEEVLRTARKNGLEQLSRIRLQVFPGNGGLYDGDSFQPAFVIEALPLQEQVTRLNENGLVLGIAEGLEKSPDQNANLKSAGGLIYAMAAQQAREQKWNDALVCNTRQHIIETSIANLFWIKNDRIYTPPLSEGCVAGVMRAWIIERAAAKGVTITEKPLPVPELMDADEVFLTNAIRGIKWVKSVENTLFTGSATQRFSAIIF
ncbi:MAG: aminotransferase class IV [Flavipsychrobacter sp.]|nr:aminotransferase class IV [Flavipsychrobacter sp.]